MSEAPKSKPHDPTSWKTFWYNEFKTMRDRTTQLQWDRIQEIPDVNKRLERARMLFAELVAECSKPPFDRVKKEVIQRVLHNAVLEAKPFGVAIEFTGYSCRWIRQVLDAWWAVHGGAVIQELQRLADEEEKNNKPMPTVNPHEDVHLTVKNYVNSLLAGSIGPKPIGKMESKVASKEGAEWQSNIERKSIVHINEITPEEFVFRDCVLKAAISHYKDKTTYSFPDKPFLIDEYPVYAESHSDAEIIHSNAVAMFPDALKRFLKYGRL
jgi:hypothetical protein